MAAPANRQSRVRLVLVLFSMSLAVLTSLVAVGAPSPVGPAAASATALPRGRSPSSTTWTKPSGLRRHRERARHSWSVTGWRLPAGQQLTITVPNHWNGRFWGRTGCQFDAAGKGGCQTGDCNGRLQCQGFGAIPATLAEYDLDAWDSLDFYDVSMVDGSNLPMYINQFGGRSKDPISANGCSAAGCTKAVVCPPVLQVRAGGRGGRLHLGLRTLWYRPVLLPGKMVEPRPPVTRSVGPSITRRCSREPSHSPIPTSTTTPRAFSPATGDCNYRITFGVTPVG